MDVAAFRALDGRPPLLDEVLPLFSGKQLCNLELKEGGYAREVLDLATRFVPEDLLLLSSFRDDVVTASRELSADVRTGLVVSRARDPVPTRRELEARVGGTGVDVRYVRDTLIPHAVLDHAMGPLRPGARLDGQRRVRARQGPWRRSGPRRLHGLPAACAGGPQEASRPEPLTSARHGAAARLPHA